MSDTLKDCWINFLKTHKKELGISSVDLNGSHTPALRSGSDVEYQGRKKTKTTNALYLIDRQGLPLSMSEPMAGNYNDLHDIEVQFEVVTETLEQANIAIEGFFLNADSSFDSTNLKQL
ncbi:hypothetical protein [Aquimarina macrocephali]|uniref:hypothetical protein n=1 Tax=Aquimarina macrocephali TaxID=666563 RepID=UPI000463C06E|nr:hypothetical protein [Aquimarina macrocephali]